jgi:FkbM family methyltransferase
MAFPMLTIPSTSVPLPRRTMVRAMRLAPQFSQLNWRVLSKLARTIGGTRQVVETFDNSRMVVDLTDFIGTRIFYFGVWEPHLSAFIQRRLSPGQLFCDIGANIGYYTLLAGRVVGPSGSVVAIEPSPTNRAALNENIALNGLSNVRVIDAAVSDRPGTLTLYHPVSGNMGATTTIASRGFVRETEVQALPLDELLRPEERQRVRLMKIDVEGAEWPVLSRLLDTIDLYPQDMEIVVELSTAATVPDAPDPDSIIERFRAAGFRAFAVKNSYEIRAYLTFSGPEVPVEITGPIIEQQDVLFSRQFPTG